MLQPTEITINVVNTFRPLWKTDKTTIDLWGGRGRGGSHAGTQYFLHKLLMPERFRGFFVRQVFNDVHDSLWKDFKDRIQEWEDINRMSLSFIRMVDGVMRVHNPATGNEIISKGVVNSSQRSAKLKSLAGATHVLIEEANELGEDDYLQLKDSVRKAGVQIQILRIFNPPSRHHWIWKDYNLIPSGVEGYFLAEPRSDRDLLSIHSTYKDNLINLNPSTVADYEARLVTRPEYYYNQIMGLIGEGAVGRIYRDWHPCTLAEFQALPYPVAYVIDFGYSHDPTAMMAVKCHNQTMWAHEMLYEPGLDNIALGKRMVDLGITVNDTVIADYGGGGDLRIAELSRGWDLPDYPALLNGFSIHCALKGPGSIATGINTLQGMEVYLTEESRNAWAEHYEYSWRLDQHKNPTDKPMDGNDHCMDCLRYAALARGVVF